MLIVCAVTVSFSETPLIPREKLFGASQPHRAVLSPDGCFVAYLAPSHGASNIWIAPLCTGNDRSALTHETSRDIRDLRWQEDSAHVLYEQDKTGDENTHIFQVDLQGHTIDLTPCEHCQARILAVSPKHPNTLLATINKDDRRWSDVYSIDLTTGAMALNTKNPGEADSYFAGDNLEVNLATRTSEDGGADVLVRDNEKGKWRLQRHWAIDENFQGIYGVEPGFYYVLGSLRADSARLLIADTRTGVVHAAGPGVLGDVDRLLLDQMTGKLEAVRSSQQRAVWHPITPLSRRAFRELGNTCDGDIEVTSRSRSDKLWLAECTRATKSTITYLLDLSTRKTTALLSGDPTLDTLPLAQMRSFSFIARDGMKIFGYLTLPVNQPAKNLPAVLLVHGGPWQRDTWGFHSDVQWLANRGYAVIQVNFRGSTGYGKHYVNAGNRQWGAKMETDLIDASRWVTSQGIADPNRIAIMGASYGGYAVLAGLAFYPHAFACGVDMAGPSDLDLLRASYAPQLTQMRRSFASRVGDSKEFLKSRSPLYSADNIVKPLLIAQSTDDPRVTIQQADAIVRAVRSHGRPVTYIVFGGEGHSLANPDNRMFMLYRIEKFLGECLGGRVEDGPAKAPSNVEIR
jgi:dipeptidyl aminopeptidase/acylaminoacyl peptidase